jgi:hypothetical protein
VKHKAVYAAAAAKDSAIALERRTMNVARDVQQRMMAEPLSLIGVGLAVGAILGAAVPNTEAENRLMGDAAEKVKHQASELASEQLDKAKDTAQNLLKEATGDNSGNAQAQQG